MTFKKGFLTTVKAVLGSTKVGSAILTAIDEIVPSAHDRALRLAIDDLVGQLGVLADRLDEDFVKRNEFADLFKNCYFIWQRTQYEDKIRAGSTQSRLRSVREELC